MKVAVILGVLQMSMGVVMKAVNSIHFRNYVDLFFEFFPQIFFLLALFGYMDVMIIVKWVTKYTPEDAPSIITTMVNMILKGGDIKTGSDPNKDAPLFSDGDK